MANAGDLQRALKIAQRKRDKADEDNVALIARMQQLDSDIAKLTAALENNDPELDAIVTGYLPDPASPTV
jgi:hypothetical protein